MNFEWMQHYFFKSRFCPVISSSGITGQACLHLDWSDETGYLLNVELDDDTSDWLRRIDTSDIEKATELASLRLENFGYKPQVA